MSTTFELDLGQHSLKLGNVADGEIQGLDCKLKIHSEHDSLPYSGIFKGEFIGQIKNQMTIPITIPHVTERKDIIEISIIGAGGTGGYVIRDFVRYIHSLREKGDHREFKIKIIDADKVEEKNILRQNFIPRDLGKNKAEVQAERYGMAFGVEIEAIPEMLTPFNISSLLGSRRDGRSTRIIVGCVDNHEARRTIANYVRNESYNPIYWIDSGNERKSGQIVCGYGVKPRSYLFRNDNWEPEPNTSYFLPNITDIYKDILDSANDDVEETVSCADRALQETQNIFVNMMAANYVLSYLRQIISQEKITINSIHFNIKGITTAEHLTKEYMRKWNNAA